MPEKLQNKSEKMLDLPESIDFRGAVGVFDSGIGGLTVLQSLIAQFPHQNFIYLGDTARLPYGTKSPETVVKYAESLTRVLLRHDVKAIVVACSTASAHAVHAVAALAPNIPVIGMIDPTARAALAATQNGHIGVMATAGTVRSGVYPAILQQLAPSVKVSSVACQMLVALAEEGWTHGEIPRLTLGNYLSALFCGPDKPDTLILGCTHFPVFTNLLRELVGDDVTLINSGDAAADALHTALGDTAYAINSHTTKHHVKFLATDDPARFAAGASRFFPLPITVSDVTLVDVTG